MSNPPAPVNKETTVNPLVPIDTPIPALDTWDGCLALHNLELLYIIVNRWGKSQ